VPVGVDVGEGGVGRGVGCVPFDAEFNNLCKRQI
jgi:hypothetical protein